MAHPVDENALAHLLTRVAEGDVSVQTALEDLRGLPYEQVEGVKVDHHRELRTGQVEAVYGPGKRPEEVRAAVAEPGLVEVRTDRATSVALHREVYTKVAAGLE